MFVLLLLGAMLVIFLERKRSFALPVNDGVVLQLVGALTHKHDTFETRVWERRFYGKLPQMLKDWIGTSWNPKGETYSATLPAGGLQFIYAMQQVESTRKLDSKQASQLVARDIHDRNIGVRLKYGDGWYSSFNRVGHVEDFASGYTLSDKLFRSALNDVPHTLEKMHLEVYRTVQGVESLVYSKEINNPLYEEVAPIGPALKLPATVSHNNVNVTLEAFALGTAGEFKRYTDSHGNSEYPDLQTLTFIRPSGTFDDPFHSTIAFRIRDDNSTGSVWGIDDLEIFYGKAAIPINWASKVNKPLERENADGLLQAFVLDNDVAAFGQPVKIVGRLVKRSGFVPDELRSVEIGMPKTGEASQQKVLRVAGLGGFTEIGPARPQITLAMVANEAVSDTYQNWDPEGTLVVRIDDVTTSERLHSVELLKPDGTLLNLKQYALVQRNSSRHLFAKYDLRNRRGWERTPAINTEEYEKVRVTVVSPPVFPLPFEFIAEPTAASVQAVRVQ